MKVIGFSAWSGRARRRSSSACWFALRQAGQRVSVVKHAHHQFDIDHPGKDSWRHRQAGAFEVVIASNRRLAKIREFEVPTEPTVHQLIAELCDCDWVLVEGFKHADLLKIEVWRASVGKKVQYPDDPFVVAIATDSASQLPVATRLPVFDLDDVDAIAAFLLGNSARYDYKPERPSTATPARPPMLSLDEALQRLLERVGRWPITNASTPSRRSAGCSPSRSFAARRAAGRQHLDGRLCAALRRRAGRRHACCRSASGFPPASRRSRCSPAAPRASSPAPQIPAGADAVVMQEQCDALPADGAVRIDTVPRRGQWIRRRGEDVRQAPRSCAAGHAADAAGARAWRRRSARRSCWWCAGRAWRCSRPATNW